MVDLGLFEKHSTVQLSNSGHATFIHFCQKKHVAVRMWHGISAVNTVIGVLQLFHSNRGKLSHLESRCAQVSGVHQNIAHILHQHLHFVHDAQPRMAEVALRISFNASTDITPMAQKQQ